MTLGLKLGFIEKVALGFKLNIADGTIVGIDVGILLGSNGV